MNKTLTNRIIFLLSISGLLVSLYLLKTYTSQSAIACFSGEGCDIVRKSTYAYPLGIPMPAIGIFGFGITAMLSFLITLKHKFHAQFVRVLLLISFLGFSFVVYLTSLEIWVIKAFCSWCLTAAGLQLLIFLLSIYLFINESRN